MGDLFERQNKISQWVCEVVHKIADIKELASSCYQDWLWERIPPWQVHWLLWRDDISHNYSTPRTLQQNEVLKRKDWTFEDMAKTLICENDLPKSIWPELLILQIMYLIDASPSQSSNWHHMNCSKVRAQISNISKSLKVSVSFTTMIRTTLVSLMQETMKVYLFAIP